METEPKLKLTIAASIDYPEASEILVSFPDQWELIQYLRHGDTPLYIAALPPGEEQPGRNQFHGLHLRLIQH